MRTMLLARRLGIVFVLGVATTSCLTPPGLRPQSAGNVTAAAATSPPPAAAAAAGARVPPAPVPGLPASFAWTSSAPIIVPTSDASA